MSQQEGTYIVCPSDASLDLFPDNTLTSYRFRLSQPLELKPNSRVALLELSFPSTYENLKKKETWATIRTPKMGGNVNSILLDIQPGSYRNADNICQAINDQITAKTRPAAGTYNPPVFYVDAITNKVWVSIVESGWSVGITGQLAYKLGLTPRFSTDSFLIVETIHAQNRPDINGLFNIFVYSNVVAPSHVGDQEVHLLRSLPCPRPEGTAVSRVFHPAYYLPVQQHRIDEIEIALRDHLGRPIPFDNNSGRTVCMLHFT